MLTSLFIASLIGLGSYVGLFVWAVFFIYGIKEFYENVLIYVLLSLIALSGSWVIWGVLNYAIYWTQYWIMLC